MNTVNEIAVKFSADSAQLISSLRAAERSMSSTLVSMEEQAAVVARAFSRLGTTVISALSVRELIRYADVMTQVESRLGLVTESSSELTSAQRALFQIAQSTRNSFEQTVTVFGRISEATKGFGLAQGQVLQVVKTINQAVAISGASAQSAEAALVQLGQGLASGVLRGEELNSVMEQTPALAKALAQGLGITTGELRALGQSGELTSEKVVGAFLAIGASVDTSFSRVGITISQAGTLIENSTVQMIGQLDRATGVTRTLGGVMSELSTIVDVTSTRLSLLDPASNDASKGFKDLSVVGIALGYTLETVLTLTANAVFVIKTLIDTAVTGVQQFSLVAQGQFSKAAALGDEYNRRAEKGRAFVDKLSETLIGSTDRAIQLQAALKGLNDSGFEGSDRKFLSLSAGIDTAAAKIQRFDAFMKGYAKNQEKANQAVADAKSKFGDLITPDVERRIRDAFGRDKEITSERQKAIESLTKSLSAEITVLKASLSLGRDLTAAEKERIIATDKLGGVIEASISIQLDEKQALDQQILSRNELKKAIEKANEAQQKALEATQAETQKILERNKQLQSEIDQIGLKTDTLAAYEAQVYDTIAAEARAAAETASIDDPALFAEKMRQAEAAESTAMLIRTKYAKLASQQLRDENQKVFDQFTDGMLDAFGRVRLEGESLAESLARAFESEFEKLILRPVIKAAFEGGDISSAIGKGFDTYNDVFNRAFTNPLGNAGVSAASSFAMSSAGRSLGLSESAVYSALDGATGDLTAAGLQFTQAAAVIGKAAPYFSAVSNALSGNYGASIGAGIGAYFGGPAGAFIGEMIGDKLLGGLFGGKKISAQDLSADQLKPISDAVTLGFTDFIKMFEGTGTANFTVSGNTGRQGENPNFTLSTDGYSSRERFAGDGLFARGEIALNEQNVADEVQRAIFAALQRSDFADNIDQVFDSLDPLTASFAELNFALQGARVLDAVNDNFGKLSGNLSALSGASLDTLQAFSNAVGGFENLGNSVAQFNQQFLSEDERLRLEIDLLSSTVKRLGVEVPQTREEFRKLVEAQDLTQQSGIRAYGSLLQMSGAVDQVFDQLEARAQEAAEESRRAAEKAAEQAQRIADEQTAQAQAIANQRIGLENQILQLMGDTATLRERELAALEPANRYLQAHIYALQDAARAQQERNQALEIERQALERVVNLGKSIADYVRGLSITDPTLSPQRRLQNSSSEFNRLLALAQGGDENALQQITGASDQFLNAAREFYGATGPFQGILENVKDALLDLPAVQTYEQQTISLLKDLVAQFAAFNDVVTIDIAVLAESEITKAIKFVSDTDLLPPDLKQLALADTLPSVTRTVAAILGDDTETQMVKRLALDTLGASVKTINGAFGNDAETVAVKTFTIGQLASTQKTITAILANDATTQEAKRLALEGLGVGQRFIEAIIASSTAPTLKSLLLDDTSVIARAFAISATVDRTKSDPALVDAVLNESSSYALKLDVALADGLISADERLVLETQKGVVDKTVNALASGGNLTEDQRAIIRAVSGTVGQRVEASVAFANSLSPDGGILAYGRAEVAAAYFANGKYLSQWLSDIAAYTMWSAGHLEAIRNLAANGAMVVRSENRSGSAVGFFADGGLVTGSGGPRSDSIAAYLSNREFVMQNSAVEKFGVGFMNNINKGMMPVMPVPYMAPMGGSQGNMVREERSSEILTELRKSNQLTSAQIRLLQASAIQATKDNSALQDEMREVKTKLGRLEEA